MPMERILSEVISLAEQAGNMMLDDSGITVENKATKENYVTSMDVKIEGFLRENLTSLIPGSFFLGEEGDPVSEGEKEYMWIVDPIDGTANFARGIRMSVVSIGLAHFGELVLGVVRHPHLGETYSAVKGNGAFLNGEPIHVSDRTKEHCMVSLAWSTYNKKLAPMCFEVSQRLYGVCEDLRRIGTAAYELCQVAKGSEDMLFEIRLAPWDYAGAAVILREAGGVISSVDGDVSLTHSCTVMAANTAGNHEFLSSVVKDVLENFRVTE